MIIVSHKVKLGVIIMAIILIPLLSISIINMCRSDKSRPASSMTVDSAASDRDVLNKSMQQEDNFFAEYRMERERVRSKEIGMLREITNDPDSTEKAREAAYIKLVDLAGKEEKEMQAEAMIKSQGFEDCVVLVSANNTMVMFKGDSPSAAEQEKIKKAVSLATGSSEKTISVVNRQQYQE